MFSKEKQMHLTRSEKSERLVTNNIATNQIFQEKTLKSGKKNQKTKQILTPGVLTLFVMWL